MTIWFTSDLHLNHENIIRYTHRPFSDVREMNETIIRNINENVAHDDTLWILGDIAMGKNKTDIISWFLDNINCIDIHLILGNHDPSINELNDSYCRFVSISHYEEIRIGTKRQNAVLSHYPIASWNGMNRGEYMLHGHIHSLSENHYNDQNKADGRRIYDVGVDSNEYRPVNAEQIIRFFDA